MGKKLFSILLCLCVSAGMAFAQNMTVTGTVTSAEDGLPVIGASVFVQGTTNGVITDANGHYTLRNVPAGGTLVFSCIGFSNQTKAAAQTVDVVLAPDSELLDQVVVTAQGLTRKQKAIGYSAQTMKQEELTSAHSYSLGNSLAGKVAGAQFHGSAGSTFSEGSIVLRGPTSYTDNVGSEPIYVIDGTITGAGAVNMDDVESINILKGPAATALYGSRGANGAVIVTTKRAAEGSSHVEFSHTTAAEVYYQHVKFQKMFGGGSAASEGATSLYAQAGGDVDVLDAKYLFEQNGWGLGDGTYIMDYLHDENWGPRYDDKTLVRTALSWDPTSSHYKETDTWSYRLNLRDLTRVAWTNNTNVAFTKSVKGMNTRVSFSNVDRPGIFENSKAVRRSFSISSQIKPNNWLTADISYRYRFRRNQNAERQGYSANGNYVCDFIQWGQTNVNIADLKDWQRPDGSWRPWNIVSPDDLTANFHDNPFAVMHNYTYTSETQYNMLAGDIYATLPYNFKLGARINNMVNGSRYEEKNGSGSINFTPYFRTYFNQTNDITAQGYLTWANQYVENRLSIEAAAFAETRKYDYYYLNSSTNGGLSVDGLFNLSASASTYSTNNSETHYKTRSFFGNTTIGWDDLVYVDGSIRYDLDSRLPADNNGYLYGGASLSFMASKLINAPWLDFWKIRGSLAQVGSTIGAYNVLPTYTIGTKFHGLTTLYEPTSQVNQHIKPTISTSYELGTEFKMFKNRFWGDINVYQKNTKNDIISATVLPQSGYSSKVINAGLVTNKGIEVMLGATPIRNRNWEWTFSANIAKNVNTLVELNPENPDQKSVNLSGNSFYFYWYCQSRVGEPIGAIATNARWKRDDNGQLILRNGTAATGDVRPTFETNEQKVVGNIQPDFTGGFNTNLRFKNLTFSAALDYVIGGQIVSWTNMWGEGSGLLASTAANNDRGVCVREPVQKGGGYHLTGVDADGNPKDGYIEAWYYNYYKYVYDQDSTIYDRTYFKLRELSLRYDFSKAVLNKFKGISRASVAFVATNPWLIYSAVPNIDPSEAGGAYGQFIEDGQALSTRTFGVSVNLTF